MRVTVPQLVASRGSKPRLVGTPGTGDKRINEKTSSCLFSIHNNKLMYYHAGKHSTFLIVTISSHFCLHIIVYEILTHK